MCVSFAGPATIHVGLKRISSFNGTSMYLISFVFAFPWTYGILRVHRNYFPSVIEILCVYHYSQFLNILFFVLPA